MAVAAEETVQILLWNYHDDMVDSPRVLGGKQAGIFTAECAENAEIFNFDFCSAGSAFSAVKDSNTYTRWLELSSPQNPTPDMLAQLRAAGELELLEPIRYYDVHDGKVESTFGLPRYAVSLIEISCMINFF